MIVLINAYGAYKNVRDSAWQVLLDYDIRTIPVNIVKIAVSSNILLLKNTETDLLKNGEIGVSILDDNQWNIIYDDTLPKGRIRFTIAHELGHIFLGHPMKLGYHGRTIDTQKPETEKQADMFAIRLLVPACVVWGLGLHTPEEIQTVFDVSFSAAKARAARMEILYERDRFLTSDLERKVYANFKEFIDSYKKN